LSIDALERPLIAVAQYAPVHGEVTHNRISSLARINEAADRGASLVVLPECCLTGLVFRERADLAAIAEPLDGVSVSAWRRVAAERDIYVVAGFAEVEGSRLYNTAVVVSPEGALAVYHKTHVFGGERMLFDLGNQLVCAETRWGRVGLAICYDLWFPEVTRTLAANGASLIASPSNWFTPPRQQGDEVDAVPMAYHLAAAAACSNEVTIACADRTGEEAGCMFLGRSFVLGPNGRPLAGPAHAIDDALILAEWPDSKQTSSQVQSHLHTRRQEIYDRPVDVVSSSPQ
jgi:predicted amidohydrolase